MASNSSPDPTPPAGTGEPREDQANTRSLAKQRFESCHWQQPAKDGEPAFCTHQDVKPYAGTAGFNPEAWCPDCEHYKLRRIPKKRPRD